MSTLINETRTNEKDCSVITTGVARLFISGALGGTMIVLGELHMSSAVPPRAKCKAHKGWGTDFHGLALDSWWDPGATSWWGPGDKIPEAPRFYDIGDVLKSSFWGHSIVYKHSWITASRWTKSLR